MKELKIYRQNWLATLVLSIANPVLSLGCMNREHLFLQKWFGPFFWVLNTVTLPLCTV